MLVSPKICKFRFFFSAWPSSETKKQAWKTKAIFKCLMYMGDLTRYQLEFVSVEEGESLAKIAKRYYLEALSVDPSHGQPFNQLAGKILF